MKAKAMFLTAAAILLGSLVVLAMNLYSPGTAATEIENIQPTDEVRPVLAIEPLDDADENAVVPVAGEKTADEIITFLTSYSQSIQSKPGWIHLQQEIDQEMMELGTLPDGTPIPSDYVFEMWYLLDDQGMISAGVTRMVDLDGTEIQVSVLEDLVWTNLTYEDRGYRVEKQPAYFDNGVISVLASLDSNEPQASRFDTRETTFAGTDVFEVILYEDFVVPVQFEGIPIEVVTIINRSVFNLNTGEFILSERVFRTVDNLDTVVSTVRTLTFERIDVVPDSILSLFKEPPQ